MIPRVGMDRYPRRVASAFGKVLLISGSAEFLAQRARLRALAAVSEEQPDHERHEELAGNLAAGELLAMTSPSLFSSASVVVLTQIENLAEGVAAELLSYAAEPSSEVATILVHSGGNKGKGVLDKLRKIPSVSEVKVSAPTSERDLIGWIRDESRGQGRRIDEQAAAFLLAAVGKDLRALSGAIDQLVNTVAPEQELSTAVVQQYFGGRADVRGYEIADAALDGNLALALERTRWAQAANVAPVLITAAVATGLRQLAALATAPQGLRDGELAAHVGVPPFKIRTIRGQLRGWDPAGVRRAIAIAAQADLDVKGGAADPDYAIEHMVLGVTAQRSR